MGDINYNNYEYNEEFDYSSLYSFTTTVHNGIVKPYVLATTADEIDKLAKNRINYYGEYCLSKYKYIINDSYSLFNNEQCTFAVTPDKYWWHYLLSKANNRLLKSITVDRPIYSYIAAEALTKIVYDFLIKDPDAEEKLKKLNECIKDGKPIDDDLLKVITSMSNRAANKARRGIKDAQDNMPGKGIDNANLKLAQVLLDKKALRNMSINKAQITKFVRDIVDKTCEAGIGKTSTIEESLFDTDNIEEIVNIENLAHPVLFEDLTVKTTKHHMNFDLYIDDSGSMCQKAAYSGPLRNISYRELSRCFAFKLYQMNMVKNIYLFSSQGQLEKISVEHLFTRKIDGGTDIKQCIENAKKLGRSSIILTDGEDYLNKSDYYNKVYFITLGNRSHISLKMFVDKKQFIFYDEGKLETPMLWMPEDGNDYNKQICTKETYQNLAKHN